MNLTKKKYFTITDTAAETSTPPTHASVEPVNFEDIDHFDAEVIPLIPLILKQMKLGNVSPEEMEILKNTFGPFWSFIMEEASRDESSEEMNPVLSELLNATKKKIVKREASPTFAWRRPIYGQRVYFDDDENVVRRRKYYGRRRRPVIEIY